MIKRFLFEVLLGIIMLVAVILFGKVGMVALSLMVFLMLFGKKKPDEREMILFYRTGNITAGVIIFFSVILYQCSDCIVNGNKIGDLWLLWLLPIFFIGHGAVGLIINKIQ